MFDELKPFKITLQDGTVVSFEPLNPGGEPDLPRDWSVYSKALDWKEWRHVGTFDQGAGELFCPRRGSKHIFRAMDAWGFNPLLLAALPNLKELTVSDEENWHLYVVTYDKFLTAARWFHFKKAGFEKQRFLPRNQWERKDNRPREVESGT